MKTFFLFKNTWLRMWYLGVVVCCLVLLFACSSDNEDDGKESVVPESAVILNVDTSVRHQKVVGFGGTESMMTDYPALSADDIDRLFGLSDVATSYQLGCNIMRVYVSNKEENWPNKLSLIKRAKDEHGTKILACFKSPCDEWKARKETIDAVEDSEEGNVIYLKEKHYGDYALFIKHYLDYMETEGVPIDYVSIQNELDLGINGDFFESCHWEPDDMYDFVRHHLAKISMKSKFVGIEGSFFGEKTLNYADLILNDPATANSIDLIAFHLYGKDEGKEYIESYPLATEKNKELWVTEYLMDDAWTKWEEVGGIENVRSKGDEVILRETMKFAELINKCMLSDFNAFLWGEMKRYCSFIGDGYAATKMNEIQKRGYIFSHFAKYVTGKTRIGVVSKGAENLSVSAYINGFENEIVVMVINANDGAYSDVKLKLPFKVRRINTIVTSRTLNVHSDIFAVDDTQYMASVEPYSVTTFVFTR
ncbi:glycoside hydrolase [Bacteroides ovatus]|uniref:hypothetical protein n=1 Tax=Bacteroides ovatus TaxID=28116 RepID=UPI0020A7136C|nr:hypothetical protein [Bacteroides ovatus]